ncbi:M20/M25/M40 family metallo-hydrolase [bacterium]|nr:M20/M25/M40 family metallo-hydrolase [bacterium]|tara:strand:+ start:19413 stop:20537 length:1125 start_codon:yes stop_codon:yes gene_type:complete
MINKKRLVKTFTDLVKIDSESRDEAKVALYIKEKLKKLGIKYKIDNSKSLTQSNHGNIIAKLGSNKTLPTILLSSHMDTVTNGIGIKPKVHKSSITSDGTTILGADDKSGLAIILETLEVLKKEKVKHYNIEAAITTCEEIGLLGAKFLDYKLIKAKEGIVLDSTSPERLVYKGPSSDYFTIKIKGVEAHSGINPEKGLSSIVVSSEIISKMKTGRINANTTINIGKINGGSAINIVPGMTEIMCEIRSHNEKTIKIELNKIKKILDLMNKKYKRINKNFSAKIKVNRIYDSINIPKNSLIIKRILSSCKKFNYKINLVETGGGADANFFVKNGVNTVNLGTGMREFHTVKETLILKEFYQSANIVINSLIIED